MSQAAAQSRASRSASFHRQRYTTIDSRWMKHKSEHNLLYDIRRSPVFSLTSMGCGDAAGLVEQVSYLLRRPIARVVQNDQGAFATRSMLRQPGVDRLAGKRVVIYEFAARELAFGGWQILK